MSVGGRIALVDDVGERLERAKRLALEALQPKLDLLHRDRNGDEHRHVPGMADRKERERCTETDLACAGHEPRIERLAPADDVEQNGPRGEIAKSEDNER